jgi:hypothetical protein
MLILNLGLIFRIMVMVVAVAVVGIVTVVAVTIGIVFVAAIMAVVVAGIVVMAMIMVSHKTGEQRFGRYSHPIGASAGHDGEDQQQAQ